MAQNLNLKKEKVSLLERRQGLKQKGPSKPLSEILKENPNFKLVEDGMGHSL
jgi:hypothetical protein|tara:strand:- start:45 stop:200 length:156 start_codon:yes stop_codon:yes gene_type:complete